MPTPKALGGLALLTTLTLAACSSATTPPPVVSPPPPVDCGAAALSGSTGRVVTGSTAQDVRIDGQPIRNAGSVRVIFPGQPVTQDYRPDRLNLEVSSTGQLIRASCN